MGFAGSRPESRQLVRHGHFTVNGKKVDIPSYICKAGDVIEVKEKSRSNGKFSTVIENKGNTVNWVNVDQEAMKANIISDPTREDIDIPVRRTLNRGTLLEIIERLRRSIRRMGADASFIIIDLSICYFRYKAKRKREGEFPFYDRGTQHQD